MMRKRITKRFTVRVLDGDNISDKLYYKDESGYHNFNADSEAKLVIRSNWELDVITDEDLDYFCYN